MNDLTLDKRIELAHYMTSNAGSLITDLFHKTLKVEEKLSDDYVTELDRAIESMCLKNIQEQFPEDGFFGEEGPKVNSKNGYVWIVDPIDGTNNFIRGLPLCGFQLAIMLEDEVQYSVILRPFTQEWFTAERGKGAFYRNRQTQEESQIKVSERGLKDSMAIFDASVGRSDNPSTQILATLSDEVAAVRVFGVAVFDLTAVASGVAEILVTGISSKYDIAAGSLLLTEAGGEMYNLKGQPSKLDDKFIIFSAKTLKEPLLKAIKSAL